MLTDLFLLVGMGLSVIGLAWVVFTVWRWWENLRWARSEEKRKAESCGVEPR